MVSDPIADMLIQIKNASLSGKMRIVLSHSKMKFSIATILVKEGYIQDVQVQDEESNRKKLVITLKYENKKSVITNVKRKSKPGRRSYVPHTSIPVVLGGMGMCVVSTSSGLMTGSQAVKRGLGGELLFEIW